MLARVSSSAGLTGARGPVLRQLTHAWQVSVVGGRPRFTMGVGLSLQPGG